MTQKQHAKQSKLALFIRQKCLEKGMMIVDLSRKLKVPENTFRQWVLRGKFPKTAVEAMADVLGVPVPKFEELGVIYVRNKNQFSNENVDLLPIIKIIAASNIRALSGRQLMFVLTESRRLGLIPSSEFVAELLKHR